MAPVLKMTETQQSGADDEVLRMVQRILKDNVVKEPPVPLRHIAENYGYTTRPVEFPGTFRQQYIAALMRVDRVILLNKSESVPTQNWGLARAFAYAQLFPGNAMQLPAEDRAYFVERRPVAAKAPVNEERADTFAALLLVPDEFLSRYRFADTKALAELFIVPEEVIRWRLDW
jgi:hypothetical protein